MKTITILRFQRACLACTAILTLPAATFGAGVRSVALPFVARPTLAQMHALAAGRGRNNTDCTTKGQGSFLGGGNSNTAAGTYAAVVAGQQNVACNQLSVIAGGSMNRIVLTSAQNAAEESFIGAGESNDIGALRSFIGAGQFGIVGDENAFVGAGYNNLADKRYSFVGGGATNAATGAAAFMGAGGSEYYETQETDGNQTIAYGNSSGGVDAFVGAGDLNSVTGNGSFIGAGGWTRAFDGVTSYGNQISGTDSFVGAGNQNVVSAGEAFIGSGDTNTIAGAEGFIGSGGVNSIASAASFASILGGNRNSVDGEYASILGGFGNTANGTYAIVAGGDGNAASGTLSFAAGYHAMASHSGSFVWSDYSSGSTALKDAAANQFVVRASGGTTIYSNEAMTSGVSLPAGGGAWASLSDRNAKTNVATLDDEAVLARLETLPVDAWSYRSESGVRHVGPMAQDFYAAFGVGEDDRHITSIDEDGVALAAIKALDHNLQRENATLRERLSKLEDKANQVDALRAELRAIEAKLRR